MELKGTALLLLLVCVIIISTTEGHIPKCCVELEDNISCQTLRRVNNYNMQKKSGSCDTVALLLHIKNKKFCADPKYSEVLKIPKKKSRKWIRDCKRVLKKINK